MNSQELIVGFVVTNLPDSLSQRKALLLAARDLLRPKHPMRARVEAMLLYLDAHEAAQLELPLPFKKEKR